MLAADYAARHHVLSAAEPLMLAIDRLGPDERQTRPHLIQVIRSLEVEARAAQWLKSGQPSRSSVLTLIGELQLKSLGADVAASLEDKDPVVRRQAALALGQLKYVEWAPGLEARLKDENYDVRRAALKSIAALQGKSATKTILEQLRSDNPDLQATAVEVLPLMDMDLVIQELTRPDSLNRSISKYALAVLLVNSDESVLHRVMARIGAKLSPDELTGMIKLIQSVRTSR
jgi:HEAT repeat protein